MVGWLLVEESVVGGFNKTYHRGAPLKCIHQNFNEKCFSYQIDFCVFIE